MALETYWMTIPATNTADNYPSNGYGGVTASPASAFVPSTTRPFRYRIYGLVLLADDATNNNTVTIKDSAGTTLASVIMTHTNTAGARYPLPDSAGLPAGAGSVTVPLNPEGGLVVEDLKFTAAQNQAATWSVNVLFAVEWGRNETIYQ